MFLFFAIILSASGAVMFYLLSRNQQLLSKALDKQPFMLVACSLEFMAFLMLWEEKSLTSALLTLVLLLMIEWSFLPLLIALFPKNRCKP